MNQSWWYDVINTLKPRQNRRHFADDIFKCIFLNENVWILIKFSLNFVAKGPTKNIPALVRIMAWRRPGDLPLSGPMMVSLQTHICVTRPQRVNMDKGKTQEPHYEAISILLLYQIRRLCYKQWRDNRIPDPGRRCDPSFHGTDNVYVLREIKTFLKVYIGDIAHQPSLVPLRTQCAKNTCYLTLGTIIS